MRLLVAVVVLCGTLLAVAEAHPLALLGATKGTALVGAGLAKIVASAIPAALLLPLAIVAPLKLAVPMLLGLKTLGLIKLKLLAAPIGLGLGKAALIKAKLGLGAVALLKTKIGLGKAALVAAGAAKLALIKAPLKLAALKVGVGKLALVKAGAVKLALIKAPLKLAALKVGAGKVALATAGAAKLALIKAPLKLAAVKVGAGKVALATAGAAKLALVKAPFKLAALKVGAGKAALATAGAAKAALLKMPVKLGAIKVGAIGGATAGATAGLVGSTALAAKSKLVHPMMIPASAFLGHGRLIKLLPVLRRRVAVENSHVALGSAHRRRRDVAETIGGPVLKEIFSFIGALDRDGCVLRVLCEVGVDPSLTGVQGVDINSFMMALDDADASAPWVEHKKASMLGRTTRSRQACQQRFSRCSKSTEELIALAHRRLNSAIAFNPVSQSVGPARETIMLVEDKNVSG